MPQIFVLPRPVALDDDASPLAGALLYFYRTGTTTPQAVYADFAITTPHSNPVVADAGGKFPKIYLDPNAAYAYRMSMTTAAGVLLYQEDDIQQFTVTPNEIASTLYPRTEAEIAASVLPTDYLRPPGDVRRYGAVGDGATNSTSGFQSAINQANSSSGSEVFIPQGSWLITSALSGVRGLKMTGEGRYRSIVLVSGAINFLAFSGTIGNPDGGAMVFRDFTIKGSASSGSLVDLDIAGQCEFHGMRFWLCGAASGAMVVLNTECHRTTFENCLFQSFTNAAILTSSVNSIISITNSQFNILSADGITPGASSACISLGSGEQIHINSCNVNGDSTLNHFVRFTGTAGNLRISECYTEHLTGSAIISDTSIVINGARIENCNLSCANSVAIDLSAGNAAHQGIRVKNIRRPETGAVYILNPGTGVVEFDYAGTLLDGSADHVSGYTGGSVRQFPNVQKFADNTHYLGSRVRHVIGPWIQDNVSGTVGSTELSGTRWIAPRAGRVTALVLKSTEARTAGTLTANIFKNTALFGAAGSALTEAPSADLNGTNTSLATGYTQSHNATFAVGDEIYVTYQTTGFTPTTADIRAYIEIEM